MARQVQVSPFSHDIVLLNIVSPMDARDRYNDGVDDLVEAIGEFVDQPSFLKKGDVCAKNQNQHVLIENRFLLLALQKLHPGLAFRQKDMADALGKLYKKQWNFSEE